MEQAINKLSEMLGVGVQEVYTVLQATAKVDGEIAFIGLIVGIVFLVLSIFTLTLFVIGIVQNEELMIMTGLFLSLIFLAIGISFTSINLRTHKLCTENPKGYAIEKILKYNDYR